MSKENKTKLLLIGSTRSDVHLRNYYSLIKGFFDEVLIVTGNEIDFCEFKKLDFGLKNPFAIFKSVKALRKIIQDYSPTLIHVHQANSYGYITALANKRRIPQVLTIWGSDVLLLPEKNLFLRHIVKKALKSSHRITADAAFIKNRVEKLVGPMHFTVANFGIDLPNIHVDISKKEKLIYSNRLHDTLYNIDVIIGAFKEFHETHTDWKLIIAGRGSQTETLKSLAKSLDHSSYSFIGFVDNETNLSYYQRASIFVSIPSSDGTSISLLEAMACGAIPVLSDLPANNEWVQNNQNGVIVKHQLIDALNAAVKLNVSEVANLNKEIILQKATKDANRTVFLEIYRDLMDRKHS